MGELVMKDSEIFGSLFSGPEYEPTPKPEAAPVEDIPTVESVEPTPEMPETEVSNVVTSIKVELDEETHTFFQGQSLFEPGTRVLTAREELEQAQEAQRQAAVMRDAAKAAIVAFEAEYRIRLDELNKAYQNATNAVWDVNRTVRLAQMAVNQAEHALRQALMDAVIKKGYIENAKKFDELTLGFKWREWALEHQIDGAKFLANAKRGILADKMGLGKTLTSLITADMLQSQRLLVIVPDDVVTNFAREIDHWAPHRTVVAIGKKTKGEREVILQVLDTLREFTVVCNYSAWRKDKSLLKKLAALRFDMMIIDEAHTIKTTSTAAFTGCRDIAFAENSCPECRGRIQHIRDTTAHMHQNIGKYVPTSYYVCVGDNPATSSTMSVDDVNLSKSCGWSVLKDVLNDVTRDYGYLRSVQHLFTMTGTPILNSPTDLYPMLHLMDDENFDNKNEFVREYCERDPYSNRIYFKPGGLDSLVKQLSSRYIGRDRNSAGVVLPKQELIYHDIDFDREKYPAQYNIIKQLTRHAAIMLEGGVTMPILAIIALITRKRQANVWPAGITLKDPETGEILFSVGDEVKESIKLDKIIERPDTTESGEWEGMVPDFTGMGDMINGERVVIFSQFRGPLEELEKRCNEAGISVVRLDGSTREEVRDQCKIDFDRRYLTEHPDYEPKWQVMLANYKTGGVGLNFTAATQTIFLDQEWNPGKEEQALMRTDRIGQTEETQAHILRLNNTIDQWLSELIEDKRDVIEGFQQNIDENQLIEFLKKEDFQ